MAERHVAGDRLSAFLDDELDDDEAMFVTRHLAWCPRCVRELESLRATRDALRQLANLHAPVLTARLHRRSRARQQRRRVVVRVALACAVPAMLLAVSVVGGDAGEAEPPTDLFLVEHLARTGAGPVPPNVGGALR